MTDLHHDDSDGESEFDLEWLLGFVDPPRHPTDLLRHRFPSKVGGRPAWLDPLHLPPRDLLTCPATGRTMQFLAQVRHILQHLVILNTCQSFSLRPVEPRQAPMAFRRRWSCRQFYVIQTRNSLPAHPLSLLPFYRPGVRSSRDIS